jgi:hypothetical protein
MEFPFRFFLSVVERTPNRSLTSVCAISVCCQWDPSLHGHYPASSRLWSRRLPTCRSGLCLPLRVGFQPTSRVSQVPRLIYRCALSPTTPAGPTALLITTPSVAGFVIFGTLATCIVAFRGRIGFTTRVMAHTFAFQGSDGEVTRAAAWSATVVSEQLLRWTPYIPQDQPGLSWRTKDAICLEIFGPRLAPWPSDKNLKSLPFRAPQRLGSKKNCALAAWREISNPPRLRSLPSLRSNPVQSFRLASVLDFTT